MNNLETSLKLPCSGSQKKYTNTGGVLTAPIPLGVGVMSISIKAFLKKENFGTS